MDSTETKLPLYVAGRMQRGVFERFLKGDVEVTDERADIACCRLDRRGEKRLQHCRDRMPIEAVTGIARLQWKSDQDRANCIRDQKSKKKRRSDGESRWTDTLPIVDAIKQGAELPLPALLHPDLHDHEGLRVIDGARRIVAHVEAGRSEFRVVIIRPKQNSSEGRGDAEQSVRADG